MKWLHMVAVALVIVGAINWGLVGLLNFNLVTMLVGAWPMLEKVVYMLVGLSGLYLAATHMSYCKVCGMKK